MYGSDSREGVRNIPPLFGSCEVSFYSAVMLTAFTHYGPDNGESGEDDASSNHDAEYFTDEGGLGCTPAGGVKAHAGSNAADDHKDDDAHDAH